MATAGQPYPPVTVRPAISSTSTTTTTPITNNNNPAAQAPSMTSAVNNHPPPSAPNPSSALNTQSQSTHQASTVGQMSIADNNNNNQMTGVITHQATSADPTPDRVVSSAEQGVLDGMGAQGMEFRHYLNESVIPLFQMAMRELAEQNPRPAQPARFLVEFFQRVHDQEEERRNRGL